MTLTLTDLFCGAGGSSTGAQLVPGVTTKMAANHWPLATRTHQLNHPAADHDCADISQVDPRRYPKTDLLWASPSCTKHSIARGKALDPSDLSAERSRATMWDVHRFTEQHKYRFVFVENVVEVRKWTGFRGWWIAHQDTGYCLHEVFHNAMFASRLGPAAAQSRDRWFCLMHPTGTPCPDVDRWVSPYTWCSSCNSAQSAYQSWKPGKSAGKYRQQYVFKCRVCHTAVKPLTRAASEIIDWSLPVQRIGDRSRPLAEKTLNRIRVGLERYGSALIPVEGRAGKLAMSLYSPIRTLTSRSETGLALPFIAELRGGGSTARPVSEPLATITASGSHHGLTIPNGPPAVEDCGFRMLQPSEYAAAQEFPADYQWDGSKRDRVRLTGNAVPVNMARDLVGCGMETIN